MFMKLRLLLLAMLLFSCKDLELKKVDEGILVKEELENINWNAVDEYPSFSNCDNLEGSAKESCFKRTLIDHINNHLASANLVVTEDVSDTLLLELQVLKSGLIEISNIQAKAYTRAAIPEIDSLIYNSISTLPKSYAAIKRGQPVTTQFQLPLIIEIN